MATPRASKDGSVTSSGIVLDISEKMERDRELETLREAHKRKILLLEKAEELAMVGSWEWNIIDNSWSMSENWNRIHGVDAHSLTTEELMKLAHPDDAERISEAMRKAREQGLPYDIRHRIVRRDNGETRHVQAMGTTELETGMGRPVRMVGVVQDITSIQENEDRLEASMKEKDLLMRELHHRVKNNLLMVSSLRLMSM